MAISGFFAAIAAQGGEAPTNATCPRAPQALIISASGSHYPGIARAISVIGFHVREVSATNFQPAQGGEPHLVILPEKEGRQLAPALMSTVLKDVEGGTPLLLDGPAPLAKELGIRDLGTRSPLTQYRWDHYAEDPLILPGRLTYPRFRAGPALQVLAYDPLNNSPLVVSGRRGRGRFIYSAIPLESQQGMVFQYLPFLGQAIVDRLHVAPELAADNLCVYVDAGGDAGLDPQTVVARLKSWSVRQVHLGAFYGSKAFQEYVPRFIAAAHREGISVYAWLEYPMVSREFWNQHPQWREVAANGHPAIMDWRYHMALEDPDCFRAVAELTRRLLQDGDWDGVDLAELYVEGDPGLFMDPGDFTPMHPIFRRMFAERFGVDPIKMFDPKSPAFGPRNPQLHEELKNLRVELVTQWTKNLLEVLAGCRAKKPHLQTTLTFIDALRDPTVTERFGVDPARLLALQKQFGFAVEIEDPYTVWDSSPDRYRAIGEYYRPRLQPGTPFSIDVNVVEREPPGRPLNQPRGLELYELLANVAAGVDLVTLYAYSTFSAEDMRLVPFVLGAQQIAEGPGEDGTVTARRQIIWRTDTRGKTVYLDGQEWPCFSDTQVLIPAGEHKVSTRPQAGGSGRSGLRLEGISSTILGAKRLGQGLTLAYDSRERCYVTLNRAPTSVLCDGAPQPGSMLGGGSHVCLMLPPGRHTITLDSPIR